MPYKDKEKAKEYHREYNREYMREWHRNNPEASKARDIKWRTNNPQKRLIFSTRQSAKLKGLEHNIEAADLNLPDYCPLIGIKIDYSAGTGKTMEKPSVDRIDPNQGYIKGNIEVMSSLANTMKSKATPEQLLLFAKEIIKRYGQDSL
jgi:hypothetical protein